MIFNSPGEVPDGKGVVGGSRVSQRFAFALQIVTLKTLFETLQFLTFQPFLFGQLLVLVPKLKQLLLQLDRHLQLLLEMHESVHNRPLPNPKVAILSPNLLILSCQSPILSLQKLKVAVCELDCLDTINFFNESLFTEGELKSVLFRIFFILEKTNFPGEAADVVVTLPALTLEFRQHNSVAFEVFLNLPTLLNLLIQGLPQTLVLLLHVFEFHLTFAQLLLQGFQPHQTILTTAGVLFQTACIIFFLFLHKL